MATARVSNHRGERICRLSRCVDLDGRPRLSVIGGSVAKSELSQHRSAAAMSSGPAPRGRGLRPPWRTSSAIVVGVATRFGSSEYQTRSSAVSLDVSLPGETLGAETSTPRIPTTGRTNATAPRPGWRNTEVPPPITASTADGDESGHAPPLNPPRRRRRATPLFLQRSQTATRKAVASQSNQALTA